MEKYKEVEINLADRVKALQDKSPTTSNNNTSPRALKLASIMKELGCINAMNLDGGGSTVMYVNGQVVNKPPIEGGIPLSHTLTVHRKNIS